MPYHTEISLLLVEDDKTSLEICRDIIALRFPKMVIHTAGNADEAMAKYKDQGHKIVITDLFPSKKAGIKIAQQVCAINPSTIVIFITADTDTRWDTLQHKAKRLCLEGIIHKPIDIMEVIAKITEAIGILNSHREHNPYDE